VCRIQPPIHMRRRQSAVHALTHVAAVRLVAGAVDAARSTAVGAVHAAGAGGLLAGAVGEGALELEEGARDLVLHGGLAALVVDGGDGRVGGVGVAAARGGAHGAAGGPAASGEEAAAGGAGGAGGVGGGMVVTRGGGHGGGAGSAAREHDGGMLVG
jgi:hypothetical protein